MKVPIPAFKDKAGRVRVFDLSDDKHRAFLTGGLPAPEFTPDGRAGCAYCAQRVDVVHIDTHVRGAQPVRALAPHPCRRRAVA